MNRKIVLEIINITTFKKILGSKGYYSLYFGTQPLFHSEKVGDNLDFSDAIYLSPSMADYYIPGLNFNKFIMNKHEKIKNKTTFVYIIIRMFMLHLNHQKQKLKNTKKINFFLLKNFHHILKRYFWLKIQRNFSKKVKDVLNNYPHLVDNSFPLGQYISLERYPLNKKFYNEVWKTKNLYNDYFQMHKNASNYQDKSIEEILKYFKKTRKILFSLC